MVATASWKAASVKSLLDQGGGLWRHSGRRAELIWSWVL